jgi:hypothetical protein
MVLVGQVVEIYGTARRQLAGAGIQTAGLAFGGEGPPNTGATEEYDGSSWTAGGTLNVVRFGLAGCGITNSCFSFWWWYTNWLQEQQNNMMEQLDIRTSYDNSKTISRLWNTNGRIRIWWKSYNSGSC